MKPITDEDLILLFYGEHDEPGLAARVAESEELTARFDALCAELAPLDLFSPPPRGADYGAEVWQRTSSLLVAAPAKTESQRHALLAAIGQPRFSLAGVFSLVLIAAVAFMLGRHDGLPIDTGMPAQDALLTGLGVEMNPRRLMNASVSGHLQQVNFVFTRFANMPDSDTTEGERVTDLLVTNRIYRQAAKARGNDQLAAFLGELEPLLIELAHEAYRNSPATRRRMQAEVRNDLLLRVRIMNQQLSQSNVST